jgi:hypothetical protein
MHKTILVGYPEGKKPFGKPSVNEKAKKKKIKLSL